MDFGEMFARISDLAGGAAVVAGVAPTGAHRYARVGKALNDIPSIAAYGIDGQPSGEHVDAIVKGLHHIERRNPDLPAADRADCERGLLTEALMGTPAAVSVRARHPALVLSPPDKEVPDAENHDLNELSFGTGDDGRTHGTLDLDSLLGEKLAVALDPLCRPVPEPDGSPDPRSTGQIRADALERLLDSYFDQEDRPTRGGAKPHVTVAVSPEYLQQLQLRGVPGATPPAMAPRFEWTGPASAPTAQMLACDSVITRILLDSESVPLDVGRDQRNSGTTSLTNMVLLCRRHHRYILHQGWTVFIGHDGHPWFLAPGSTTELRSHARRTLTTELTAA